MCLPACQKIEWPWIKPVFCLWGLDWCYWSLIDWRQQPGMTACFSKQAHCVANKKEPSAFSTTVFLFAICHDLEVYPPVFSSLWLPLVFVCFPAVLPSLVSFSLITPSVFRILSANGTTNIVYFSSVSQYFTFFFETGCFWAKSVYEISFGDGAQLCCYYLSLQAVFFVS